MTVQIFELLCPPQSEARAIILQSLSPRAATPTPISTLTSILRPVDMYGVPISTSSGRAGKKSFRQEGAPTGHLPKIPRLWATPNFRGESRACWTGVGWSPPGALPALSHVKSFIRSSTRCWDRQSAQETRAETRSPVTHQPPPRPASHVSHLHIHTLYSHTYPPPLPGHTLHALRSGSRTITTPALPRADRTRSGLQVLARGGRVLTAQRPLGNVVPIGTPAF